MNDKLLRTIFILLIICVGGLIGYNYIKNKTAQQGNKESNNQEIVEENQTADTNDEETIELDKTLYNFILKTEKFLFTGTSVTNFENKLTDSEKMYLTLYAKYGTELVGSSICSEETIEEQVSPSSLPVLFSDMSFLTKYENMEYLTPDNTLAGSDKYQDANPYMIRFENGNFYLRSRLCGSEGVEPYSLINIISTIKKDNQLIVKLNYVYASVASISDSGEVTYNTYSTYEGKTLVETLTNDAKPDYTKYTTYTITFNIIDNGYTFSSIKED